VTVSDLQVFLPYNEWQIMPPLRRTQTVFVTLDPFLSPRAAVLHHFEEFLAGLEEVEFPCISVTGMTRAQLAEPRRRLGSGHPFIGESGCGVYLPEDYFHLKAPNSIRLGRFTCIPVAKPQPAAAEALEELAGDLGISAVSLRSLSLRELSQNTGLPASEAEQIRMRDFDELFFFAGANDEDITRFAEEAKARGLALQRNGAFWSLSCGGDLTKCIRELGGMYDRALRYHALRVGVGVQSGEEANSEFTLKALTAGCDRTIVLHEKSEHGAGVHAGAEESFEDDAGDDAAELPEQSGRGRRNSFYLKAPGIWDEVLDAIHARK
jgi:predicted mannosyl-3-phosphoglycerate phosphatase (HAD superfamily)